MELYPLYTTITTQDNLQLPAFLFTDKESSKKVAIFLHGNGTANIFYNYDKMKAFSEALLRCGISFFAFNNRGANLIKRFRYINADGEKIVRNEGTAYELLHECVMDIDGAIAYLQSVGYEEFYLIGESTGANKLCVYDFYKKNNLVRKYVISGGGDDLGVYYEMLGKDVFCKLLDASREKIASGKGEELIPYDKLQGQILSYQSYYDTCNPDGDYNCFPYREYFNGWTLSKEQLLFDKFSHIAKETYVIYGGDDSFAWADMDAVKKIILEKSIHSEKITIEVIPGAEHAFSNVLDVYTQKVAAWLSEDFCIES